jgi:hypothetical protein
LFELVGVLVLFMSTKYLLQSLLAEARVFGFLVDISFRLTSGFGLVIILNDNALAQELLLDLKAP